MSIVKNITAFNSESILVGLSVFFIALIIQYFFNKNRRKSRLEKFAETLQGPATLPYLGNSLDLWTAENSIQLMIKYFQKYGHTYRLWWGKQLIVGMSKAEDLEMIYMNSKLLGKPEIFVSFKEIWGNELFTSSVQLWKKLRKRLQPVFGSNLITAHIPQINNKINYCLNMMENLVNGLEFNAWNFIPYLSFDVITKTTFDIEFEWNNKLVRDYEESAEKALELGLLALCLPWLQNKFIRDLFYERKREKLRNNMFALGRKIINEKLDRITVTEFQHYQGKPFKNFLTIANELQKEINDDSYLCQEVVNIITGGTNTTATQICFCLLALAMHQDIQVKLYKEIHGLFGNSDREANREDLKRLPYLDQVIKETLRRFTPVPCILRGVEEDTKIGDRIIPAGTVLLVSVAGVHFDSEYYSDPWNFNPDHFHLEAVEKRPKYAFIPFSAGARNCIGKNFAMLEMKLVITAFLRKFSVHTAMKMDDIKLTSGFVISCHSGFKISIKSRNM